MSFTENDVREAGRAVALREEQLEGLLTVLRARRGTAQGTGIAPAPTQPVRFDLVHLLWYAGALIVMGAMGLFSTLAFEQMGGKALTLTALIYAVLFVIAGHYLWYRRSLETPGGLMIAVAVAMIPLAVYGLQEAYGLWDDAGAPGRYRDFYVWVKSSWLPMEIATVFAGLIALRFYPFPFIVAVIAVALWFMSMDLTPWILQGHDLGWAGSWKARRIVSMIFGLIVLCAAWFVDLKRDQKRDFAFWLYLSGLLAFWGALTASDSSNEVAKAIYCLINVALIFLSVFLMRRAYAVFGTIGVSIYLGHLADKVFKDSLLFPFALSLIGIAIIATGLFLHKHRAVLSAWMTNLLPVSLKKLRPPHADAATRMEHA
ncbi:hypothetical protein [Microvirga terricola]|uniref:DUF2157 domain-containing protein n=1 Tax=Microvirga terricola TaxID=2719797 RepID=A0ABX0VBK5_9HYPH|nr:hypothetical protein [Microvirga terricola]NIX75766.1 hypothetical protein [Microvirga terricola]